MNTKNRQNTIKNIQSNKSYSWTSRTHVCLIEKQ